MSIEITISDDAQSALETGGTPLQSLCLEEAENFNTFLVNYANTSNDPEAKIYSHGLASWERQVIAGYLYQKLRGRF